MKRKAVIAISSVVFICLLLFGFDSLYGTLYDYFPSWKKLPAVPSKPIRIENIEISNVIVLGDDNQPYRYYLRTEDVWTQTSELYPREFQYMSRTYEACDYTKGYFRIWLTFHPDIVDCKVESEGFGDGSEHVSIAIDSQGNVWLHTWEYSAIGAVSTSLCCLPLFAAFGILIGLILLGEWQKA